MGIRRKARALAEKAGLGPAIFRFVEWREGRKARAPQTDDSGVPLPPPSLMFKVVAITDWRAFLASGESQLRAFAAAADRHGGDFAGAARILDFGCGCGRLARHVPKLSRGELFGVDYNPTLARWCAKNLKGNFSVNRLEPPLDFPDRHFDVVYALSVFTHMRLATQDAWLGELARVIRPGGFALLTFHDEDHPAAASVGLASEAIAARGLVVHNDQAEGSNYMATFQSRAFAAAQCGKQFDVLEIVPSRDSPLGQALAVLRRPR